MAFDREKFKTLVHYVCATVPNRADLGAVKLNKVCWLADFIQFYNTGTSITDARYIRRKFGPVPASMPSALTELQSEGALRVSQVSFHGRPKTEFVALKPPDRSKFSAGEIALIDDMAKFVCKEHTAASISELSHDHIWKAASDGEEIPYYTVFSKTGELTDSDREWARLQLESY